MYSIISFSIAACKSLRAPSCSSCSKNGFSSSSARFSSEITLFSLTGVSFLFGTSGEAAGGLFFLLKGCAFSHLFIHNFRLYLYSRTPVLLYFRVEPAVADWLPHSPVRAQLKHTVLQARISLRRWSGQPLGAVAGKTA